jgi:hypothetical protein
MHPHAEAIERDAHRVDEERCVVAHAQQQRMRGAVGRADLQQWLLGRTGASDLPVGQRDRVQALDRPLGKVVFGDLCPELPGELDEQRRVRMTLGEERSELLQHG